MSDFESTPLLVSVNGRPFVSIQSRIKHLQRHIFILNEIIGRAHERGDIWKQHYLGFYRMKLAGKLRRFEEVERYTKEGIF